jgi:hypothetical protein
MSSRPGRAADVSSECRVLATTINTEYKPCEGRRPKEERSPERSVIEKDVVALVHEGDGLGGGDLQVAVDAALQRFVKSWSESCAESTAPPLLDGLLFEHPLL